MTDGARRQRVEEICDAALDREESDRDAFVAAACGDDAPLREQVRSLLAHAAAAEAFLEQDALGAVVADVMREMSSSLMAGTNIGAYRITGHIGVGGMGEVYRARDTKLNRDVALKVLPAAFAADADRLARFQRESQILASLTHPNIAHIYGIEEANDARALVLELVEGPTLADRIAEGPIPVDEATSIALQIVAALEAAHEQGFIHRDLKPANVKLRPDGIVKVLDFGLAKALKARPADGGPDLATITSAGMERAGLLLGTAAYMSPEQAKGQEADSRSDVWAFGCVSYEMLTGRRAFDCDDLSATLVAVIMEAPDWSALPSTTPIGLRRLLRRCLEKDPKRRLQAIGDARVLMEDLTADPSDAIVTPQPLRTKLWWRPAAIPATVAFAAGVATAAFAWFVADSTLEPPRASRLPASVTRLLIVPSESAPLRTENRHIVAVSPDGARVAYVGGTATSSRILVRSMNQLTPLPISREHRNIADLSISPDGQWVAFFSENEFLVKKVPISGGSEVIVGRPDAYPIGTTWSPDGQILYVTATGLWRVGNSNAPPALVWGLDDGNGGRGRRWNSPQLLPSGRAVLLNVHAAGDTSDGHIAVLDLDTGSEKVVVRRGSQPHYLASGHVAYAVGDAIEVVRFDAERLEAHGSPVPVLPTAAASPPIPQFDVSSNGTLAYVEGRIPSTARTLVWVDRDGREEPLRAPARFYGHPRISPDGTRLVVDTLDDEADIWTWDFTRETLTRLTFGRARDVAPIWTPDGRHVLFQSDRDGPRHVYRLAADGTGNIERITDSVGIHVPSSMALRGSRLLFTVMGPQLRPALMTAALDANLRPGPLLSASYGTAHAEVSPNERWLAYVSWESAEAEVFVRPFPDVMAARWQVSVNGGGQPVWSRDGHELFYLNSESVLMRVPIDASTGWKSTTPTKVLELRDFFVEFPTAVRLYDVAPDGRRFLLVKQTHEDETNQSERPHLVVVQNWPDEFNVLPFDSPE